MAFAPFVWEIKTVWHPKVNDWKERPGSLARRLPKTCRELLSSAMSWALAVRQRQQQSAGISFPKGSCNICCKEAYHSHFRTWQNKVRRNWFVKSNKWPEGLKMFAILYLKFKQLLEKTQPPFIGVIFYDWMYVSWNVQLTVGFNLSIECRLLSIPIFLVTSKLLQVNNIWK